MLSDTLGYHIMHFLLIRPPGRTDWSATSTHSTPREYNLGSNPPTSRVARSSGVRNPNPNPARARVACVSYHFVK